MGAISFDGGRIEVDAALVAKALQLEPEALRAAATSSEPVTFGPAQWQLVEALTARIIPTDHQPGAREANCVNFIDKALARAPRQALRRPRPGGPTGRRTG